MGFFDSIGLGSVAKVLDVGGIVKNVVDGVLPKNLAAVGDLAGAVVDFKTGNVAAAMQHALESLRDLPQVARGLQPGAGNSPNNLNRMPMQFEPPPPPLASRQGKAFDWNDLLAAIKALTAALNRQGTPGTAATSSTANGSATATSTPTTAPASTGSTATPTTTTTSASTSSQPSTATGAASAPVASSAPAPSTPAASSKPTTHPPNPFAQAWAGTQDAVAQYRAEHHRRSWRLPPPPAAGGWRGQPTPSAPAAANRPPSTDTTALANAATATAAAAKAAKAGDHAANAATPSSTANPTVPASTTTSAPKPETPASAGIATTPSAPTATQTNSGKTDSGKTGAGQPSTGQTISSIAQLNGMSDAAIRDAVINGRISPDVLKDQGAVMVLQQRMQAIAEMNNLMTAMMRALHDMQMAVIQNIRI